MENKLTAVEWLINNLFQDNYLICTGGIEDKDLVEYIKKAKSMEKEYIINAHLEGWGDAYDYLKDENSEARQAEDYYKETYGK